MSSDDPENRSEYVGPTTIPRARVPKSVEHQSVKLDPKIDRRRARTMVSQKALVRASRRYTWTAFVAGALGATVASLVYLALNGTGGGPAQPAATAAPASEPIATGAVRRGVVVEPDLPVSAGALDTAARPGPGASAGAAPVRPAPSATAVEAVRELSPPAPLPRSETPGPRPEPTPTPPVVATEAPPEAAPSGSSRVWVKPPDRKPWVQ